VPALALAPTLRDRSVGVGLGISAGALEALGCPRAILTSNCCWEEEREGGIREKAVGEMGSAGRGEDRWEAEKGESLADRDPLGTPARQEDQSSPGEEDRKVESLAQGQRLRGEAHTLFRTGQEGSSRRKEVGEDSLEVRSGCRGASRHAEDRGVTRSRWQDRSA
jgi:hypothetical protein